AFQPAVSPSSQPRDRRRIAAAVLVAFLATASLPSLFGRLGRQWTAFGQVATIRRSVPLPGVPAPWGESRSVASRIRDLTRPEDRIFVWADEPLLYFYSDRRMAGPY